MAIPNIYKDTLDDLIDSLDINFLKQPDSPDWLESIGEGIRNVSMSKDASPNLSKENCLDKDIFIMSLQQAHKTWNFQVYKYHNVTSLSSMSRRVEYKESQRGGEDEKDKKSGEIRRDEKSRRGHNRDKVNPVVGENGGSETSIYYHIIYRYY